MKAAVLRQIGRLDIEDVELDGAHAGEVRIRDRRASATGFTSSRALLVMGPRQ